MSQSKVLHAPGCPGESGLLDLCECGPLVVDVPLKEVLWSISATGMGEKEAVELFARTYWSEPRHVEWIGPGMFVMRGGAGRRYSLTTLRGPHGPMYQVQVAS